MAISDTLQPPFLPVWTRKLRAKAGSKSEACLLRDGILTLANHQPKNAHALGLKEQPFDSLLLKLSPLYRLSRRTYFAQGGIFDATLLSSTRSLSSVTLLDQCIEYSPIERELIWAATDSIDSKDTKLPHLYASIVYTTAVLHEQSHRILWHFLPGPPPMKKNDGGGFRYLNFVESLVITLDLALGDELGGDLSNILYLAGLTYELGTDIRRKKIARRVYRNYLHACLYTTYLLLQFHEPTEIRDIVMRLYGLDGKLTKLAIDRAIQLNQIFVGVTNLDWQEKNQEVVVKRLTRKNFTPLEVPRDPMDNNVIYFWAEKWFRKMGI